MNNQPILSRINQLQTLLKTNLLFEQPMFQQTLKNLQLLSYNVQHQKHNIAVIAAMKAGKSTLLNSLIGHDLLPNETDACTASITEIKNEDSLSLSIEKVYEDQVIEQISASSVLPLYSAFHQDVRKSREQQGKPIAKYVVQAPIESLKSLPNKMDYFVLTDTPGPNEASTNGFDATGLREIAYEQLRIADAVVIVLDYTQYKSDINAQLIRDIFAGNTYLSKEVDKVFFVLNKIDKRTEKDYSLEHTIEEVKKFIVHHSDGAIVAPNVFAVSALKALLGRMLLSDETKEYALEKIKESYGMLYATKVVIDGVEYSALPETVELSKMLLNDSSITSFEEVVLKQKYQHTKEQVLKNAELKLKYIEGMIISHVKTIEKLLQVDHLDLKNSIENTEQQLTMLQQQTDVIVRDFETRTQIFANNVQLNLTNRYELIDVLNDCLSRYQERIESTREEDLQQQLEQINRNAFQVAQNWQLRKKDSMIRLFNEYQMDNLTTLQKFFQQLSKEASEVIRKQIDFELPAIHQFGDVHSLEYRSFSSEILQQSERSQPQRVNLENMVNVVTDVIKIKDQLKPTQSIPTTIPPETPLPIPGGKIDPAIWITVAESVAKLLGDLMDKAAAKKETAYYTNIDDIKKSILEYYNAEIAQWSQQLSALVDQYILITKKDLEQTITQFMDMLKSYLQSIYTDAENSKQQQQLVQQNIENAKQILHTLEIIS